MLIIERTSNGRTIVTIKRDWHPGRIGIARVPQPRRMSTHEVQWQKVLCKLSTV